MVSSKDCGPSCSKANGQFLTGAGCISDCSLAWTHPVCHHYFIRQKLEKNLINENSKQGLIDNLQSVCPANIEPSSYNQIHVASNPVYLLHNIIIISIRLARPLISADTSNNDGNSFAKILHRFAKLTEIDLRTPLLPATVW